eukprot:jgi/Mesvir1/6490/Mv16761-RA.2
MEVPVMSKSVERVELYRWLPTYRCLSVWPFALTWLIIIVAAVVALDITDALICLGIAVLLQVLTVLGTYWSVDFKCFVLCRKEADVSKAEIVKVTPAKFAGSKELCNLETREQTILESAMLPSQQRPQDKDKKVTQFCFDFRKKHFVLHPDDRHFHKLRFPVKESVGTYVQQRGYGTEQRCMAGARMWGENRFDFPAPQFWPLFKEQCLAPFFVFQVFCVGLWCLDEYWYYSLFTLGMLVMFESTVVKTRLRSLAQLRRIAPLPDIWVHRAGRWSNVPGESLLPGDVVSVGRKVPSRTPAPHTSGAGAVANSGHAAGAAGGGGVGSTGGGGGEEELVVPADVLLLYGSVIANEALLTGESTPQWKTPVQGSLPPSEPLSMKQHKGHLLFGGTKILLHTPDKDAPLKAPDGGCLAVVLRTGFNTSQGKLMRTILFSTERVTANNWESGLFILFLLVFALIAAGYVLVKGLEDPNRSRYKLFLNCSLIITSVIPPELPMELSIAVNASLMALHRLHVFCSEPFRIPFAGKVDVCCFDKTGTLTSDDMVFEGVAGLPCRAEGGSEESSEELRTDASQLPLLTVAVLASCHSLVQVEGKLVGDPLEKAAIQGVDWLYQGRDVAVNKRLPGQVVHIAHRHHFSSALKRMAVVATLEGFPGAELGALWVLAKGAPETMEQRLAHVPEGYEGVYKKFTRQGARVLTLAYKRIPLDIPMGDLRSLEREELENDLVFGGFAVFSCPLKRHSEATLQMLKAASHHLVMITGDQALTACHVASKVHIVDRPAIILMPQGLHGDLLHPEWVSPDEVLRIPFFEEQTPLLAQDYDMCLCGQGLKLLQRRGCLAQVVPFVQVYARVSPDQKETILKELKALGRVTLMCGDGTNDVGALKQVGTLPYLTRSWEVV